MDRTALSIVLSFVAGGALLLFAGFFDAAGHSSSSMFILFPYGATVFHMTDWQAMGLLMMILQFPLYTAAVLTSGSLRLRIGVVLILIAIHLATAFFTLRGFCRSRRTCWNGVTQQIVARERNQIGYLPQTQELIWYTIRSNSTLQLSAGG
jgi:hypothetical protein